MSGGGLHGPRPLLVRGRHVRRGGALCLAGRLPPEARRAVGLVGIVDHRRRRLRRLPHLPRIRLPRHLARRRHPAPAARVPHRHGSGAPAAGRPSRPPQRSASGRPAPPLRPLRLGTDPPAPRSGSHRHRWPHHHVGGCHRHLRPRRPGVHGELGPRARSDQPAPHSPLGARPGRLRRWGLDHGSHHAPLPLVRPARPQPPSRRCGRGLRVPDRCSHRPRSGGVHRSRSSRLRAGRCADAGGGAGIGLAGSTGSRTRPAGGAAVSVESNVDLGAEEGAAGAGPFVLVDELRKRFVSDGPDVVDGISFSVGRGELFGLLGPNGAGKTTTIGVITTRVHPSGGRVLVDGIDVSQDPVAVKRRIAVVPQQS
ncbi:MAG: ATP-binding cassette domain-containing protein, partial [Actinobacteria bacterium]|nr:ATP-binding cassette domain-containing protein [Actinomycetota bacterium]